MAEEVESVLRKLGERGDIIKRIHCGLAERGPERAAADFILDGETRGDPIVGRLLARGLDDELKGSAFAVIDGIDRRTHHVRLNDLDAASDAAIGAVVEARRLSSRDGGSPRRVLAVRSDFFDRGPNPRGGRDLARPKPRRHGAHARFRKRVSVARFETR